ncbi:MAG TPA: formate dehydrogenase subunit delta [Alphaproteobacteria bacterium]|nr:formate dehydrogenase subunit delta [Alphaproteobacteria bacterium]
MEIKHLVHMANQIADFFKSYPEAEAIDGVATHIRQFWDPRMRAQLAKHFEAGGDGLNAISLAAAKRLLQKASTP